MTQKYTSFYDYILFLAFKQFYLRAFLCVQSLSVEFFDDLLSLKIYSRHFEKQFCHLLNIIRQKDDSDRRLERITYKKFPVSLGNLFEVQFLMTCNSHLWRGNYREISGSSRPIRTQEIQ